LASPRAVSAVAGAFCRAMRTICSDRTTPFLMFAIVRQVRGRLSRGVPSNGALPGSAPYVA
jgi:hypothetical protein